MPKVPAWKQRLHQLHLNPPHYEASWYGPIDKLANQVFAADCFMVKPQPKLRPTAKPHVDADGPLFEDEGLSIDSMGTPVIPTSYFEPDFIIVLMDDARDIPLVCIEVKKEGESFQSAGSQLNEYIETLVTKDPHDEFVAILVLAGNSTVTVLVGGEHPLPVDEAGRRRRT